MGWNELYPETFRPSTDDMAAYIGGEAAGLWREILDYAQDAYRVKPKLSYSGCSMQPGWNVKLAKSGQALGTLYPEEGQFSVLLVISYRLEGEMENALPDLSDEMRARWAQAQDYMKLGKWMMFPVRCREDLNDYKRLMAVKLAPKA